jgi:hypothetical protein
MTVMINVSLLIPGAVYLAKFRIFGAKSDLQSRLLNGCSKLMSSPAGRLLAPLA